MGREDGAVGSKPRGQLDAKVPVSLLVAEVCSSGVACD